MLLVLFLLMNLADLVTAWFILEGEANRLHILAGRGFCTLRRSLSF
jgi:hypothetical protein